MCKTFGLELFFKKLKKGIDLIKSKYLLKLVAQG